MPYKDLENQRRYQREWIAKRRSAWMAEHGPCIRCGSWNSLQLDHRDNKAKVDHRIWSWTDERRETELSKCQVLCGPCHHKKTWTEDGRKRAGHGSYVMYGEYRCRCDECRAYKRVMNAKRIRTNKSRG